MTEANNNFNQFSTSQSTPNLLPATYSKETLRTGIDTFLGQLQTAINAQILSNTKLPIVGNKLSNGQQIINNFRDDITRELNKLPSNATADELKTALFAALKPLNLLQDLDGNKVIDAKDIKINETANGLDIQLKIGQGLTALNTTTPIGFKTDLPGLGLDVTGKVQSQLGFDFNLNFGLDKNQSFFVNTASADEFNLSLKANITLPQNAKGKLGFLSIDVKDLQNEPTGFEGKFAIDLKGGGDNRLTGGELSDLNLDATLTGKAGINLNTKTTFNNSKVLPSLDANLNVGWNFNNINADSDRLGTFGTAPTVALNNVRIEAGSFFSKFASPLLKNVQTVYKPIEPIVNILTKKIDLGKFQFTALDVAKALGYIDAEDKRFIESIKKVGDLLKTLKGGKDIWIEQGNYNLGNLNVYNAGALNNAVPTLVGAFNSNNNANSQVSKFFKDTKGISGLSFSLLSNPGSAVNLLLGKQNVTLFDYDLPNLGFSFPYEQFFPIIGPLGASVKGKFGVGIDLSFGFDTKGLNFSNNNFDLLSGFYINDRNKAGKDINEVSLNASIKAFAALNGAVAEVGVGGGIVGLVGFNLKDKDKDGKIRISELNFKDPLCMFDISGQLKAELTAYYRVGYGSFGYSQEFNSPAVTLLDYNYSKKCSTAPSLVLATKKGKGLTLNTGPNAKSQVKPTTPPSDKPGVITFNSASYSVNENGTPVNVISLTRTNGSKGAVSVTLTPSNGTATAQGDYNNAPITVNFANGEISKTVSIPIVNDTTVEGNETVKLSLSNPTGGATLGTQKTATLTIIDNDSPPPKQDVISFSSANYSVNENGTPVKEITLTRTNASDKAISVILTPSNGTATAGDYDNAPITVNFDNGQTSATVSIPLVNDTAVEGNETIALKLSNPTDGATLGTQKTATLTIIDNDLAPPAPKVNVVWTQFIGESKTGLFVYNGSSTVKLSDAVISSYSISGNNIVWNDSPSHGIYLYNGIATKQLTSNLAGNPKVSGNNVVWEAWDGNDHEIYFYNGSTTIQLTNNDRNDYFPEISGSNVVWRRDYDNDSEIYFYNGSTTIQLTNNDQNDYSPKISGNNIIWQTWDGNDGEMYLYNGSTTIQLTNNEVNEVNPEISGNNVVWEAWNGNDGEIYLYNGSTTIQLTNNDRDDYYPEISGNNVVWEAWDGNDGEIYLYNGSTTIQLTNNDRDDYYPEISGDNVVWQAWDGNDTEIYLYNGSTVKQLTKNNVDDLRPDISSNSSPTALSISSLTTPNQTATSTTSQPQTTTTPVKIEEPYNTLAKATFIPSLAGSETYSDTVGKNDTVDLYRIEVLEPGALKLLLNGTTDNVNLELLDSKGEILNSSTEEDTAPDYITYAVDIGTYYIRVILADTQVDSTPYNLTVTTDQNEYFKVTHKGSNAEGEIVTITAFNFSESGKPFDRDGEDPLSQEVSGITSITADGGLGDDIIELAPGVTSPATLTGGAGNDRLTGGDGNDIISGNQGLDVIVGGKGNDKLQGNEGDDLLVGEAGNDTLDGGADLDTASYSTSKQAVRINLLTNTVTGGDAQGDTLISIENLEGSAFADSLTGNAGNNLLNGGDGNDTLNGEGGDDILIGGGGADSLNGGDGSDTAFYVTSLAGITVNLANLTATGGDAKGDKLNSIENLAGSPFDDRLTGDSANNTLEGDLGNDTLDGGLGNDTLIGGGGDDTYIIDSPNDVIDEKALENQSNSGTEAQAQKGIDTVQVAFTYTLGNTLENLTLTGNLAINGTGNASNNLLIGNGANNNLSGLAGDDTLIGGIGNDTLNGGTDNDTASYRTSVQGVKVNLLTNTVTGGEAQGDTLIAIENLEGSAKNDTLIGSNAINILLGGNGNDSLSGQEGNDTLIGGLGADTLDGGDGSDTASYLFSTKGVTVNLATSTASGGEGTEDRVTEIENLIGSFWQDNLTGNNLNNLLEGGLSNDTLTGGLGNDTLDGGLADDILIGGLGRDTLTGGSGNDRFRFILPTEGIDSITDFDEFDDLLEVSASGFKDGLKAGAPILESQFTIGTKATTQDHRFIYDDQTRALFFDIDGTGAIAQSQIATLSTRSTQLILTDANIVVIA